MSLAAIALSLPQPAEVKPASARGVAPVARARLDEPQAPSFEQVLDEAAQDSVPVAEASQNKSDEQAPAQGESQESAESTDPISTDDQASVPLDEDLTEDVSGQGLVVGLPIVPVLETLAAAVQGVAVTTDVSSAPDVAQQVLAQAAPVSVGTQQAVGSDANALAKAESTGPVAVVEVGQPQSHAQGQAFTQQQDTPSQTPFSNQEQAPVVTSEPAMDAPVTKADTSEPTKVSVQAPIATLGDAVASATPVEVSAARTQPVVPTASLGLTTQADAPSDSVNTARIARGLSSVIQQNGGAVTLRLTPVNLGTIRIQLQIQGGTVNAQFQASTESARQVLTQQLTQLRSALEGQGLVVDRLSVQSPSSSSSYQAQQHADGSPDGRSRGEYTGQQGQSREQQDPEASEDARSLFERLFSTEPTPAQGVAS